MQTWKLAYKGHTIEVTNSLFRERLIVDGEIQEEQTGIAFTRGLHGQINSGDGTGESINVSIVAGLWSVHCVVLVNDKEVLRT